MSEKTLKLKKIFVYTLYNNLKNTPAKVYPTTEEVLETLKLLPKLKEPVQDYISLMLKVEDVHKEYKPKLKGLSDEETKKVSKEKKEKLDKLNEEIIDYNSEHSADACEIKLDEATLKSLKAQFERNDWGKAWVVNIEEFGEILAALEEACK